MFRVVCVSFGVLTPFLLSYFLELHYNNKKRKLRTTNNRNDAFYTQLIPFNMKNFDCTDHIFNNEECGEHCSNYQLNTLLNLIASAKYSISLCMYHFTLRVIMDHLIKAQLRGVEIQVITDSVMKNMKYAKPKVLQEKFGVPVVTAPFEGNYMHHKFCIIDAEEQQLRKVVFGSLNWTLQGCVKNFEMMLFTNNPLIVKRFYEEFKNLWARFNT